jgi:pimeloyl-ACP methyl ester carboxylesterase
MKSQDVVFDVTAATGLEEQVSIMGTLHLPEDCGKSEKLDLLLCLHGGGYRRAYWDFPCMGAAEYSFARFFTSQHKAVLALDQLGMGDSSKPQPESKLSRASIAAANAHSLAQAVQRLTDGTWASAAAISVTGVGHSIGGMMIITQAATHRGLDRVAVLGWANQPMVLGDTDTAKLSATLIPSGYLPSPRPALRKLFYLPDVPPAVIEVDEALGTETPACLGRDALTPAIVHAAAGQIAVPVLIVHGEVDTSPDPWGEVPFFNSSRDVTLSVLGGSAHCHNLASSRHEHWSRLNRWVDSLPAQRNIGGALS